MRFLNLFFVFLSGLSFLSVLSGCKKEGASPLSPQEAAQETLVKKGRAAYFARCTACHNADPKVAGSLGPELQGSSLELLKLRVLEGKYPEGYQPKRNTQLMVPIKEAADEIEALHAFLNQ